MSNTPQQPVATAHWTNEVATIAGATASSVIYGPLVPMMPDPQTMVYKHTVQIQLLDHAAHEWPLAMIYLEGMCSTAIRDTWAGALKFLCYVSRDTREGVIITVGIVFDHPDGINSLKAMDAYNKFIDWLTGGDENGRATWSVSDSPVPALFA